MSKYKYDNNYFLVGGEETFTINDTEVVRQEFLGGIYINGVQFSQQTINKIENKVRLEYEYKEGWNPFFTDNNYDEYMKYVGERIILDLLKIIK